MPGDELHEEAAAMAKAVAEAGRARIGPRHAAPRKPFLTRLHMPAGKAIAMAAMPSAVLMGMGLTPQLANAKQPVPKSPFKDGPCVSAPDKEEEAEKQEAAEKAAEEKAAKEKAEKKKAEAAKKAAEEKAAEEKAAKEKAEAEKEDSGSSDTSGSDSSESSGSSDSGDAGSDEPEPSPSESEKSNPLDPLGLGDAVKDLLTPDEKEAAEEEQAAEEKAAEEKAAEEKAAAQSEPEKDSLTKPVEDTVDKVEKGLEDTTDKVGEGVEGAKDGLEKADPSATDEEKATGTDENGKKAFPCVEEKKVAGENEQTSLTLPNQPWYLEASSLALHGLSYKGVVNVKTANGSTKQVLKFTAKSVDIGDLHQIVDGPGGTKYHVEAAKGSNSTIRDGQVTMYTERLEGNLFGLVPIVFDPEHPPPLDIPEAYFTHVKVKQAGQFGGTLTVPGLDQSITQ